MKDMVHKVIFPFYVTPFYKFFIKKSIEVLRHILVVVSVNVRIRVYILKDKCITLDSY